MPDNINNDYNELAKLIYPSIEASGNVYYGQTRKLAIDELFNINDGGFESNIKTIRRQTDSNEDGFEYISYFCWKFGPLNGRIRIVPCDNNKFIFTFANFPELEKIYNLDDTYITNDSTDPIVGTLFIRYKLLLNDNTVEHILNSGTFNSYEKIISVDTNDIRVYITDNCDPTNVDNRDIDDRNIFVKHESDVYYLFVKLCNCADIEKPEIDTFDPNVPFFIENMGDVPVEVGLYNHSSSAHVRTNCKISYDNSTWQDYNLALATDPKDSTISKINLANKGDRVYIKADLTGTADNNNYTHLTVLNESANTKIRVRGNTASINKGTNDVYKTDYLTADSYCYYYMFNGCTSLTQTPELPATTLNNNCYARMFVNCTNLTQAPELPATTLADYCYSMMFQGCTSLTHVPDLPATTLAGSCYYYMFSGCTSLTQTPELPATTLADYCYYSMFLNCTSLNQAHKLPATTLTDYCYTYMFHGCTSLAKAPELPAGTLAVYCYYNMFYGCGSLNHVKCLATNISMSSSTADWLSGVSSTGDFYTLASTNWSTGTNGIPSGWTRHDI